MDSGKNVEKFRTNLLLSTAKCTRYLAYFSGNVRENVLEENFIQ